MVTLEDITGTIGEWLDSDFDLEVPEVVIKALHLAYNLSVAELEKH